MHEMARQAEQAIAEADVLLFLVDGRAGRTPHDENIAARLRRAGRPVHLVVNKAEGIDRAMVAADFHALGLGDPLPVSAAHGDGVKQLVELVLAPFPTRRREGALRRRRPQGRHRRPPQRRQVHPGEHPARRGARDRLRHAGHHPRRHLHPLRARRQALHPHRHRRPAPARQGLRGGGEVLGHQDPAGGAGVQRGRAGARRRAGHLRPGRPHRRLRARGRARAGGGDQQVGRGGRLPPRPPRRPTSRASSPSCPSRASTRSRRSRPRASSGC